MFLSGGGGIITIDESKTKDRKDGKNRPPRVVGITPQLKRDLENYLYLIKDGGYIKEGFNPSFIVIFFTF